MKKSTANTFNKMNEYQRAWCIAKAKVDTYKDEQKKVESDPTEYRRIGTLYLEALSEWKIATAQLLTFAKEHIAKDMKGRPELADVLKLYEDDINNYLHVDILPDRWQSKLIDATLRTNFVN